jgi:hypothetical protein
VSNKAIIAILSKTRPIARMLFSLSISFPPPGLCERRDRGIARRGIAVRRPAVPCKLPSGSDWLHEIKHDGFRIIACKTGAQVRLYSRPGNDLTRRFPLIVETMARLRSRSCIIDGEAVACDDDGVASFDLLRHHRANDKIFPYAFNLIELNARTCGSQNKIIIYWPKADGIEFPIADGRVRRAMLEPGARVPPRCLEAVRSRLRAAQVVQVGRYVHSNRLLVAKHAHVQSSAHPFPCLIELSCS